MSLHPDDARLIAEARFGFVDADNSPTCTHVIKMVLDDEGIALWCGDCSMMGAYTRDDAEHAAERVRRHSVDCDAGLVGS